MSRNKGLVGNLFSLVSYTNRIIFLNIVFYFVFLVVAIFNKDIGNWIFLYPSRIIDGTAVWTLITSMFMHGGFIHLFVNMFSLFFLGNFSEQIIGRKRFLFLYILAGIIGGLFYVFGAFIGSNIPVLASAFGTLDSGAVGASGALFGLLGLLAVLLPKFKVYLVAGPLILIIISFVIGGVVPGAVGNAISMIASILTLVMIFAMFSSNPRFRKYSVPIGMEMWLAPVVAIVPLVIISFFVQMPIGNTAHFGGLVLGIIFGIVLRFKYPRKVLLLQRIIGRGKN